MPHSLKSGKELLIPKEESIRRIKMENVWWSPPHRIVDYYAEMKPRAYFDLFLPLVKNVSVRRAVVLMGPRRVGKTVLVHHSVQQLIKDGIPPKRIFYVSVDHPLYNGCGLEDLLRYYGEASGVDFTQEQSFLFFDEVQYLKDWEVHLKSLVDSFPNLRFTVSGSAAAALKLSSKESGAGRFTDFALPPLTFHEYLDLLGQSNLIRYEQDLIAYEDIGKINAKFQDYLNFGGYPEVIFSESIQSDPGRFIKSDI
ncbi:MAG: ATP-binding protein, partial [Nitrospiria bacterium]